jgi:hypothetical protein
MRRLGGLIIVCAALLFVTPAHASVPSYGDRLDAKNFARQFWANRGYETLCYGVRFSFRSLGHNRLAYVPGNLDGTSKCAVVFNRQIDWGHNLDWGGADDWWRLCRIAIHEYGHLPGMPFEFPPLHSHSPSNIMATFEEMQTESWWWPFFPACRYDGDDQDGDGEPDW